MIPSLSGTRHPDATPLIPSRHSNMESPEPSDFRAESQEPRDITEDYDVFSDSATSVASFITTASDESAVEVGPDEGTGFVGGIRRFLRFRHHNNHESASRHGGLGLVRQNAGLAGRHGGLGFRQRVLEFARRQIGRYRHRRMLRRQENALASQQARNTQQNIEDRDALLRRFDNLLAARQARDNQNIEDHNSQYAFELPAFDLLQLPYDPWHAYGSDMSGVFLLQNDSIEGHSLPSSQIQTRADSSVHSYDGGIPYYTTRYDDNNELGGTDNSDDDPLSDQGSEVRRGRPLRRAGSNFSDGFSGVRGGNHPSRDHSEEPRGRRLRRDGSPRRAGL